MGVNNSFYKILIHNISGIFIITKVFSHLNLLRVFFFTWRCAAPGWVSFARALGRGGWCSRGPLKQFVLHFGSLDIDTWFPQEYNTVQHFQCYQSTKGKGRERGYLIRKRLHFFPVLQVVLQSFKCTIQLVWTDESLLKKTYSNLKWCHNLKSALISNILKLCSFFQSVG